MNKPIMTKSMVQSAYAFAYSRLMQSIDALKEKQKQLISLTHDYLEGKLSAEIYCKFIQSYAVVYDTYKHMQKSFESISERLRGLREHGDTNNTNR